ncbi:MAG: hypothetical protein U5P10_17930 [Spirochaetia bacterium]|nr:hypothetical protein [Spirochaetia bacterium]
MQKLYAFVMLLGYSRRPFVLFTTNMRLSTVLLAHLAAFAWFGAVPREILLRQHENRLAESGRQLDRKSWASLIGLGLWVYASEV